MQNKIHVIIGNSVDNENENNDRKNNVKDKDPTTTTRTVIIRMATGLYSFSYENNIKNWSIHSKSKWCRIIHNEAMAKKYKNNENFAFIWSGEDLRSDRKIFFFRLFHLSFLFQNNEETKSLSVQWLSIVYHYYYEGNRQYNKSTGDEQTNERLNDEKTETTHFISNNFSIRAWNILNNYYHHSL